MENLPTFDNHDSRIKYFELFLENTLENIPHYDLPEGYHFEFYKDGDRDEWIKIEKSAKEFSSYEEGIAAWNRYYQGYEQELTNRMVFVVNSTHEKVATATAFYDTFGRDNSGAGWLHWVAVKREYQGKGLSKPLISHVFELMKDLGYLHAKIPTQTTTWVACRIYLDFGFLPVPQNAINCLDGWRIMRTLTDHPLLSQFDYAELNEILA